ncbi:MAG: helix-turn-helix transcriptional regulator [Thermoguttaceae bacterium]|jgi:DNA-binding CsgD family transcriptional regulator
MSSATLQIRHLDPLLTEDQWLRVAARLEMSEREYQIVRLVFEDEHERNIATQLGISLHTVHTHLKHLHRKLGVRSRVGLVLRVVREYLADDGQDQPEFTRLMPLRSTRKVA